MSDRLPVRQRVQARVPRLGRKPVAAAAALAAMALVFAACQPPTLGPAPVLPAPGGSAGPNECAPISAQGVNYYGSLKYGHDNDFNQDLYLDALIPTSGQGPFPAVIYVHGGAHVEGKKCEGQAQRVYLAQHGFAVFSIDYPLASATQSASYEQPTDTELAVQWVRANAGVLEVNPNKIGLWGGSAGADLAVGAAYRAQQNDPAAQVQAVAGWSGSYDAVGDYYRNPSNPVISDETEYLGCSDLLDQGCLATAVTASPMAFVSHDDPPTFLANSTDVTSGCESMYPQNAVELDNALQARGVPVVFDTTNACGHALAYWNQPVNPPATGTMIDNLVSFFQTELGSTPTMATTPAPLPPRLTRPTIATPASTCSPPAGSGVSYTANVTYGRDFNEPLYADLYRPAGVTTALPTVVLLHHGGFDSGDKCDADVTSAAIQLAQQGYEAVSANYPLATSSQPTFPNPVYDVMNGVTDLRAHASTLHIDPSHIALFGAGAGANLALDAAMDAPLIDPGAAVQAVVSYSGDTDAFEAMGEYQVAGAAEADVNWPAYIGCSNPVTTTWDPTANACYTSYQEASPALATDSFGGAYPAGPALLVVNSSDFTTNGTCETTPPRQAEEMQLHAADVGLNTTLAYPAACAHGFDYLSSELSQTLSFLQANLAPPTTTVVLPSNGATLSGTQPLDATVSSGATGVQYELSGGSLTDSVIATATPTLYGWLANWNTASVPNGTYTLQSVASYQGGVSGTGPGIAITVSN